MFYKSFCLPERHSPCKQKPSSSINLNAICWKFHLGMWPQSRWGKWGWSTSGNRTFFEARWPNDGSGSKAKNPNINPCHQFQKLHICFDKQGKTQFNNAFFSTIHCNTDSTVNISFFYVSFSKLRGWSHPKPGSLPRAIWAVACKFIVSAPHCW